jgi:hypothetical protein
MLFDEERSLFQTKINKICDTPLVKDVINDLIKLELLKDSEKNEKMSAVGELYNLLGPELFTEVIELINGRTVQFPNPDSFKETIMIAIHYYYRFFKEKDYNSIAALFDDEDINTNKMGIKISGLHQFIQKQTQLLRARKEKEDGRRITIV